MNYKVIKQWKTAEGYDAVVIAASPTYPHYCGYVAVPEDHPAHGKEAYAFIEKDDEEKYTKEYVRVMRQMNEVSVHGGITYAGPALRQGKETKYPYPIPLKYDGYWFGFDAAHAGDAVDWKLGEQLITTEEEKIQVKQVKKIMTPVKSDTIRTLEYIENECNQLSKQLGEIK